MAYASLAWLACNKKATPIGVAFWVNKSLAVTYFHMGRPHTIIGAKSFHFRVRYGIGWFQFAMAAKQNCAADAA